MHGGRKLAAKTDAVLIGAILAAAVCALGFLNRQESGGSCEILVENRAVQTISLRKDAMFTLPERPGIVLQVKDHAIAFRESDCPDKICVHTGTISRPGQMAACLPNQTVIRIRRAAPDNGVDTVAG
ncbi:MAG: NusG domain II-containing protein [Clostridiales bacterium]|nr:NusG domain II-containing protein [Clostridiales bacterium]